MKIEFIANACFLVTFENGKTLITDPWFESPCFYGTWSNFPPVENKERYKNINIDYIYVSHIHPDHLHPPTLKLFDRRAKILIPMQSHGHLRKRIEPFGFSSIHEFPLGKREEFEGLEFVFFRDFAASSFGQSDGINYEMDSAFLVTDSDGTSLLNANDNPIQVSDAAKIVSEFGKPTISVIPASGSSLYPHAFLNLSEEEKKLETEKLTVRMLDKFLEVAKTLDSEKIIPATGAYVIPGAIAEYTRYLHQPTPDDIKNAWNKNNLSGERLLMFGVGDEFDSATNTMKINPSAKFRNFTAEERLNYALTLKDVTLPHEEIVIPDVFELDWSRLLPKARKNLWDMQSRLKNFPGWNVELEITGRDPYDFKFAYNSENLGFLADNQKTIRYVVDSNLLLLAMVQMISWNGIEGASLVKVDRRPNVFELEVHNLMNFFHL